MRGADGFRVGEGLAAEFGREARGEVFEGAQFVAEGDGREWGRGVVVVEDYGEDGLRAAGVLDCLRGEEDVVFCGRCVVGPI